MIPGRFARWFATRSSVADLCDWLQWVRSVVVEEARPVRTMKPRPCHSACAPGCRECVRLIAPDWDAPTDSEIHEVTASDAAWRRTLERFDEMIENSTISEGGGKVLHFQPYDEEQRALIRRLSEKYPGDKS